jgi:hypothetical protein
MSRCCVAPCAATLCHTKSESTQPPAFCQTHIRAGCVRLYSDTLHTLCVLLGITDGSDRLHRVVLYATCIAAAGLNGAAVAVCEQLVKHQNELQRAVSGFTHTHAPMDRIAIAHALNAALLCCVFCAMIVVAALLQMWIAGRDALQVLKLRECALRNDVLVHTWWTRYMLVPTSCALATAALSQGHGGTRVSLMAFSVFEFAQAAAFLFTLAIDLMAAGHSAFADRAYFAYLACAFSVPALVGDSFARFAVLDGVDFYEVLLFFAAGSLWLALFVAQHRHYSLANLFMRVWPQGQFIIAQAPENRKKQRDDTSNHANDSPDASTVVVHDADKRVFTICLTDDFNMYNHLHTPDKKTESHSFGLRVSLAGAGLRMFDATFADNERATRSMIGRLFLWRITWGVQVCALGVLGAALLLLLHVHT